MEDFNKIYDLYWYKVYTYAYNIIRNKETAEDITQEIFVDLWNRFDKIELLEPSHLKYYILKAAKYQCFKRLRDTSSYSEIQLDKIEHALIFLDENFKEKMQLKEELIKQIEEKAINILPPKCYHVFQMRYYKNKTYKEISTDLNISLNTVDNHIKKALKLLRESDFNFEALLLSVLYYNMF